MKQEPLELVATHSGLVNEKFEPLNTVPSGMYRIKK